MDTRKQFGGSGEDVAARFLEGKGWAIIERQYRTRFGEVDIIATRNGAVHFVEVKTRKTDTYGLPEEAVTAAKLRKIALVAAHYLARRGWQHLPHQVDVVAIRLDVASGAARIRHLENVGDNFA